MDGGDFRRRFTLTNENGTGVLSLIGMSEFLVWSFIYLYRKGVPTSFSKELVFVKGKFHATQYIWL